MPGLGMTGDNPPPPMWTSVINGNNFTRYASINHPEKDGLEAVSQ
jgi:hypothetical protein